MVDIRFGEFRVGSVVQSSGIFAGSNTQWKMKHASKENQAFGTVNGQQCSVADVVGVLADFDEIDTELDGKRREP
ncbi:hypothetical protein [Cohnella thermotolerans]|uniref:hypothetical protein n=1 Tax=Cohnella thermotolerans TaxID=329858 RepID=UPI0004236101|nr:hypothetical protein [Cohnella thermotolerans]